MQENESGEYNVNTYILVLVMVGLIITNFNITNKEFKAEDKFDYIQYVYLGDLTPLQDSIVSMVLNDKLEKVSFKGSFFDDEAIRTEVRSSDGRLEIETFYFDEEEKLETSRLASSGENSGLYFLLKGEFE